VALPGADPKRFHFGDGVELKIELPDPWNTIHCFGQVRQAWASREDPKMIVLGIQFINMPLVDLRKLTEYIYGDTHIDDWSLVAFLFYCFDLEAPKPEPVSTGEHHQRPGLTLVVSSHPTFGLDCSLLLPTQ
jgi:hypothetical protein